MSHEPGLRFWLRRVEQEGGLVEEGDDYAVALLPAPLQRDAGLPEEITVTSDPEVAAEEGAVLLIAGHPALERAAASVLEQGDVGRIYLPWPASDRPRRTKLEAEARESLTVAHGRIDAAAEPVASYLPLLRVGAMVSYSASLTHRFQEKEEAWVDARTGLAVPEHVLRALSGRPWRGEPDASGAALDVDLPLALREAHAMLEQRACAREAAMLGQARRALEAELARADVYYRGAVESIERRAASAQRERRHVLEGQAEATRNEHARRRREIREEFQPRHEIRPFRLHLVRAPAYVLPVNIRRGARSFSFSLCWLPTPGAFVAYRCPHCGAATELVAGRDRLGCQSCLGRQTIVGQARAVFETRRFDSDPGRAAALTGQIPAPAGERPGTAGGHGAAVGGSGKGDRRMTASPRPKTGRVAPPPAARRPMANERGRGRDGGGRRGESIGPKLAMSFWQNVVAGDRWPKKKTDPDSPMAALYRLYGAEGPLWALGIPTRCLPSGVSAVTITPIHSSLELTAGELTVGAREYPYCLRWRFANGRAVLSEVTPVPHLARAARSVAGPAAVRLLESTPAPTIELDPVAAILWRTELPVAGLAVAVRCLATWWRIRNLCQPSHPPGAIAATVADAVARAAGIGRSQAQVVSSYESDRPAVQRLARELARQLRIVRERGW